MLPKLKKRANRCLGLLAAGAATLLLSGSGGEVGSGSALSAKPDIGSALRRALAAVAKENSGPNSNKSAAKTRRRTSAGRMKPDELGLSLDLIGNTYYPRRIFALIVAMRDEHFYLTEDHFDVFRDLCEIGSEVSVVYMTAVPMTPERLKLLNERMTCRNPEGSIEAKVVLRSPHAGFHFGDYARHFFYDNLEENDFFMYLEDDAMIRPFQVASYVEETLRVRQLVGAEDFFKYSAGFARYEVNPEKVRVTFEYKDVHIIDHPGVHPNIQGKYMTTDTKYQGMWVALQDQLRNWGDKPGCNFKDGETRPEWSYFPLEFANSFHLFNTCGVKHLMPIVGHDDFMVHHASNKFTYRQQGHSGTKEMQRSVYELQKIRMNYLRRQQDGASEDAEGYKGIEMVVEEPFTEESKEFLEGLKGPMEEYEQFIQSGGKDLP